MLDSETFIFFKVLRSRSRVAMLTQIRSWTMGRLPSDVARCRGVLASLGLIGAFTSS